MSGSSFSLDLYLGGVITLLLLSLLVLKELASSSRNPGWQRIGRLLSVPILPLLFLFFILAGYRGMLVLGLQPAPQTGEPGTSVAVAAASETATPFRPIANHIGLTHTPSPTPSLIPVRSPTPQQTPSATATMTMMATLPPPTVTFVPPGPVVPSVTPTIMPTPLPSPTSTPQPTAVPAATDTSTPGEPEPTLTPTPTEPSPEPEPTRGLPTPTTAPTESEEPPGGRPTPTPAPLPQ